ncbi:hypothetical protein [Phenylobacterium sp.]|uniref:hypothetical protein n=1 Tax=Phenylobacterium sp. TaxID=1871053 RepID=UPI0035AE4F28
MDLQRRIARILGPVIVAVALSEAANMDIFAEQTAPVVYLNGAVLFTAGVAILQAHAAWRRDWTVLITLAGWVLAAAGLYRLIWPRAVQATEGPATTAALLLLAAAGAYLCWRGYRR